MATYNFQDFGLDKDWVESVGEEGALNRELKVRLGSQCNGPITLCEHGPGVIALADELETYLEKYPNSVILVKWLDDMITSAVMVLSSQWYEG